MRSKEFLPELVTRANDIAHFRRRIAMAAQLCARLGDRPLVFRSFGHAQESTTLLAKVTNDDRANPQEPRVGTNRQAQLAIMQRLGIEHPTFCTLTPPKDVREFYGRAHIFIPLDLSPPWYSPRVRDLGGSWIVTGRKVTRGGQQPDGSRDFSWMNDRVQEFADSYVHAWPAGRTANELIFDADTYYLLEMENFLRRFAGPSFQHSLPSERPERPRWTQKIHRSTWDQLSTYAQVAEFLSTTAPEYLDHWQQQQTPPTQPATGSPGDMPR
jgi:hypothetical protein